MQEPAPGDTASWLPVVLMATPEGVAAGLPAGLEA